MSFLSEMLDSWARALEQARDQALSDLKPLAGVLGFSAERIYAYSVLANRLIPDDDIPAISNFQGELLNAVLNDTSIPSALRLASISGPSMLLRQFLMYGERHYYFGLPEMGFKSPPIHEEEFEDIVEAFLDEKSYTPQLPIAVNFSPISIITPTPYEWALSYLQINEDYTDRVTISGNVYVLLEAEIAAGNCRAKLVRYTAPNTPVYEYIALPDITDSEFQVHYQWKATVQDSGGNRFILSYLFPYDYAGQSSEHPEMVESPTGDYDNEDLTRHLPVIPFKRLGIYTTSDDTPDYYASCVAAARKLNLDLDQIVNSLKDEEDMESVPEAYLVLGVNPHTDHKAVSEYLFYYFYMLYYAMAQSSYEYFLTAEDRSSTVHLVKVTESSYNVSIFFNYIKLEHVDEVIGSVGTVSKTINLESETVTPNEFGVSITYINNNLILKRQVTPTSCDKLTVFGLRSLCYIIAADGHESGQVVDLDDTANFLIPLNFLVANFKNPALVEALLYRSMHLVLFAASYEDLEWYETSNFIQFLQFVIQVIAIIAMFYTKDATWVKILGKMLISWVTREIFKHILQTFVLTDEQAAVLIIAYAAVTIASGDGNFSDLELADKILISISAVSSGITIYTGVEQEKLKEEWKDKQAEYKNYEEYLKAINEEFDTSDNLDPYYLTKKPRIPRDTPDEFFARTLNTNSTNICRNYCSSFLSTKLDLESINRVI